MAISPGSETGRERLRPGRGSRMRTRPHAWASELHEKAGWHASPRPVVTRDVDWAVFALEVPLGHVPRG